MRKLVIALLLGLFLVLVMVAPALAQARDPFDPVISQAEITGAGTGTGDGTGTNGDGTGTDGTGTNGDDGATVLGENGADGLANTGSDTEPWLVAAYALIAVGAGALLVSKVNAQTA